MRMELKKMVSEKSEIERLKIRVTEVSREERDIDTHKRVKEKCIDGKRSLFYENIKYWDS